MLGNFLGSLVQSCCREGGTLQTNITGVCGECSQCCRDTGFFPTHGMCTFPVYTAQALGCSARNCLRQALGYMHFPGLSHSGPGTWVHLTGADAFGPSFCALPWSETLRWPAVWWVIAVTPAYHLSCSCCSVFWVYNWLTFSGRCWPSRIPGSLG